MIIKFIREDVNTPWPISMESEFKEYFDSMYISTGRMSDYTTELSEDQLTKIVKRNFRDSESFMLFKNDPQLLEIKTRRKKYMLENNIVMFTSVDYPDD